MDSTQKAVICNGHNYMEAIRNSQIVLWNPLIGLVQACRITTTGFQSFLLYCRKTEFWEHLVMMLKFNVLCRGSYHGILRPVV